MPSAKSLKYPKNYTGQRLFALACFLGSSDPKAVRDALTVLIRGLWFEHLRLETRQVTAYGVGKQIQPQTYKPATEGRWPQHHNLWAKYARGIHSPGPETVRAAEQLVPGSSELLIAVAWKALDLSHPIGSNGDALLRRLRHGVQAAVFQPRPLQAGHYLRRTTPNLPLQMLECQADLDGLAALVILLREAYEAADYGRAFAIGRSMHAALLLATSYTPLLLVASELFEFFVRKIFPLATSEEIAFDLHPAELYEQMRLLNRTILQLEDGGKIRYTRGPPMRVWRKVLNLGFGFDLYFGLGPHWRLIKPPEECSEASRDFVRSMNIGRKWGLSALRSGRPEPLLPSEVAAQMAAARQASQIPTPSNRQQS
ncbi:hypothetical protein [Dyella agri]|uniref:Uncharacterized protein n=1 Tax=Dyella agri TaxID=1926869 RepID=A0ABW8KKW4_9GAMM